MNIIFYHSGNISVISVINRLLDVFYKKRTNQVLKTGLSLLEGVYKFDALLFFYLYVQTPKYYSSKTYASDYYTITFDIIVIVA